MPVAVLHDEFTPGSGRGGVCATGEIIIGFLFARLVVTDGVA